MSEKDETKKGAGKKTPAKSATDLEKARKHYVAKRNDMIQKSKKSLSLVENKAVSYIFSKIQPTDTPDTVYNFDCKEFYRLLRWKKESYSDIRAMLYSIASQTWGIVDEETGTEKIVHWFNTIHLKKGRNGKIVSDSDLPSRFVEIKIHEDLRDYVFGLEEQRKSGQSFYSAYQLQNVSLFSHSYSQNIYELLKSYENIGKWTFEYGTGTDNDIQIRIATYEQEVDPEERTGEKKGGRKKRFTVRPTNFVPVIPSSWSKFHYFERDVLKPAVEEINKYTDINIDYKASKTDINGVQRRKFSTVTFYVKKKTLAQRKIADDQIDELYKDFDDQLEFKQSNIFDFLETYDTETKADSQKEAFEREEKKEKDIEKAQYKVAASVFYDDFTQKQIVHLVEEAFKHIPPMRVNQSDKEMWAIDYISHYHDKIKATAEETRTSTYRRLLDCVIKDYDQFADQITAYDRREDKWESFLGLEDEYAEEPVSPVAPAKEPYEEDDAYRKKYSLPIDVTYEEKESPADEYDDVDEISAEMERLQKKLEELERLKKLKGKKNG